MIQQTQLVHCPQNPQLMFVTMNRLKPMNYSAVVNVFIPLITVMNIDCGIKLLLKSDSQVLCTCIKLTGPMINLTILVDFTLLLL